MERFSFFAQCLVMLICWQLTSPGFAASSTNSANQANRSKITVGETFYLGENIPCLSISEEQYANVSLRLNGVATDWKPIGCEPGLAKFVFEIQDLSNANATDREILSGHPWRHTEDNFVRELRYSISINENSGTQILASGLAWHRVLSWPRLLLGSLFILAVAIGLLKMGKQSAILKDRLGGSSSASYSLSRVQMAWWFFIVFASYIWLWIVGESIPSLSTQALGLLSIGSGTCLAAASIDMNKTPGDVKSDGFWLDLLSDSSGITLHRFQLLIFNIVIGFFFLSYVIQNVVMPEFDGNVLSLLGLSSATYAGFKIPEQQSSNATPATRSADTVTAQTEAKPTQDTTDTTKTS